MTLTPQWLQQILSEKAVTDICLNGGVSTFIDRGKGLERYPCTPSFSPESLREWVIEQLSFAGKTWDAKHPFVDCTLTSGHRLHAAFPPMTAQGILVSLRRLPRNDFAKGNSFTFEANISSAARWQSSPLFKNLSQAVKNGESVLISGSTGSGKTTLAGDLLGEIPHHERIIALEDTPELSPNHPHFLTLLSRPPNSDGFGEVTLSTLLKQTLRMRPDRIILGECRGKEVLDLLQSLNTGHRGALATLHANSPREALRRIELLCLIHHGGSIPIPAIRELLTLGIQWIAQVKRVGSDRLISELCQVQGREGDTILLRQVVD